MLQTRSGKRTGYAAVVIATDFVKEKLVTPKEAILLVDPEALSQLLAPGFDPEGMEGARDRHQGPAGVARRRLRQGGVLVRDRGRVVEQGRAGDPGPPRNRARRHSRHVGVAGHSHRDRRHDLARRGGRPPDGQAVDRRRRRAAHRRARQVVHREGQDRQGRRLRRVRRPDRRSEARQGRVAAERDPAGGRRQDEAGGLADLPALQHAARLDRQVPPPRRARQRGSAGPGRARLRVRRPRHRPVPHRAHVLRRRPHPDRAAHDPRGQRSRSPRGAQRAAADAARRLLRRVQGA